MLKVQSGLALVLAGLMLSADEEDSSGSFGSESLGSGSTDASSGISDEASSASSIYSSLESSSPDKVGRRRYRRAYRGRGYRDYRDIPPRY
jgi:hypothetical protein